MIETWYTQPRKSSASYYHYDKKNLILVRIRLELGRSDKGGAKAIFTDDRYVGFSDTTLKRSTQKERDNFTINTNNQIVNTENGRVVLINDPKKADGKNVYDFSLNGNTHPKFVHRGNKVTTRPLLPYYIDSNGKVVQVVEDDLEELASLAIGSRKTIDLVPYNSTEEKLVKKIFKLIGK